MCGSFVPSSWFQEELGENRAGISVRPEWGVLHLDEGIPAHPFHRRLSSVLEGELYFRAAVSSCFRICHSTCVFSLLVLDEPRGRLWWRCRLPVAGAVLGALPQGEHHRLNSKECLGSGEMRALGGGPVLDQFPPSSAHVKNYKN